MRKSRGLAGILLALAALALFVAGPIMIYEGVHGQNQVRDPPEVLRHEELTSS